jgi:hypothetical protein
MWWLLVGAVSGGVVIGVLAPVLLVADAMVADDLEVFRETFGLGYTIAAAALIAGVWGAIGGTLAGMVCAVVTSVRERRPGASRSYYAWSATVVTAVLAGLIGASNFLDESTVSAWDVFVWVGAPVAVSGAAAHRLGGWVWRRTHVRHLEPA